MLWLRCRNLVSKLFIKITKLSKYMGKINIFICSHDIARVLNTCQRTARRRMAKIRIENGKGPKSLITREEFSRHIGVPLDKFEQHLR